MTERVTELSVGWFYSPLGFYGSITQKQKKFLGSPFSAGDVFYSNYLLICLPVFNAIHNSLFWTAVVSHNDCISITPSSIIEQVQRWFYFCINLNTKGKWDITSHFVSTSRTHHMTRTSRIPFHILFTALCLSLCFVLMEKFMYKQNTWGTMIKRGTQRHQLVIDALYLIWPFV